MERELEGLQRKLEDGLKIMIEDLENSHLKKLTKNAYLKMASCQDLSSSSNRMECTQKAGIPLENVQHMINNEMNQFQKRIQHCAQTCENELHDKFYPFDEKNRDSIEKHQYDCAKKCVEQSLSYLKSVKSKLEKDISQL